MTRGKHRGDKGSAAKLSSAEYKRTLYDLRVQLVRLQKQVIREGPRILVVFEGRDGAGKDGTIKRIIKNLSPRETRVVALGKPSDREESSWYFERFVSQLGAVTVSARRVEMRRNPIRSERLAVDGNLARRPREDERKGLGERFLREVRLSLGIAECAARGRRATHFLV